MARKTELFRPEQLRAVAEAVPLARDLTGHYFALTDEWFEENSHEVCTARNLRQGEVLRDGRLAQIRRLYRVREGAPGALLRCQRLCPHYRICLQDHNLLTLAEREPDLDLPGVLTWVLTHEYVHMIRFRRFQHPYDAPMGLRADEEARVEELTRRILSRLGDRKLRRLADRVGA